MLLTLLLSCVAFAWGQDRTCAPSVNWVRPRSDANTVHLIEPTNAPALELFDRVSANVRYYYLDQDYNGLDWRSAHRAFRELVALAFNDQEVYALLEELVACLGDDHSYFLSPQEVERGPYGIGLLTLSLADRLYVSYSYPDGPADLLGLRPRDRILSVNGSRSELSGHLWRDALPLRLKVQTPGEAPRAITLEEGWFEPYIVPTAHRLEQAPGIGYLSLAALDSEGLERRVEMALAQLLRDERTLKGLILDLRGNPGGSINQTLGIAGQFVGGEFAREASRFGEGLLVAPPGRHLAALSRVPLVVLIDGYTKSAAELLAAGLQHRGRAKVVGQASAANTEIIYAYAYDDGSELWLAFSQTLRLDGSRIGETGVIPDVLIAPEVIWLDYPSEDDPYILRALELLRGDP